MGTGPSRVISGCEAPLVRQHDAESYEATGSQQPVAPRWGNHAGSEVRTAHKGVGKSRRFATIFIPMGLTIASLVCLVIVCVGQSNKHVGLSNDMYFFKAITKNFKDKPDISSFQLPSNQQIDNNLLNALQSSAKTNKLSDFYKVGLRGYCEGKIENSREFVTSCSPQKNYYWFNFQAIWGLNTVPDDIKKAMESYQRVAKWMNVCFGLALATTVLEILISFTALSSRWGSFATTIISSLSSIFTFAAALTVTLLYISLVSVFETDLKPYNIQASIGKQMLSVLWLAVALSIVSGFFWLVSVCCCSSKSGQKQRKKVNAEKTPYTYERVASPYMGASANAQEVPLVPPHEGPALKFEPYRHV